MQQFKRVRFDKIYLSVQNIVVRKSGTFEDCDIRNLIVVTRQAAYVYKSETHLRAYWKFKKHLNYLTILLSGAELEIFWDR